MFLLSILLFSDALDQGKLVTQPVVIQVSLPGCVPCERLKKQLQTRKDFVYTTTNRDDERLKKYNIPIKLVPHFIILYYTPSGYQVIGHGQVNDLENFNKLLEASLKNVPKE